MNQSVLQGKVALVTGGNSGIGCGEAKSLVEAGAFVYITGRRQDTKKQEMEQVAARQRVNYLNCLHHC